MDDTGPYFDDEISLRYQSYHTGDDESQDPCTRRSKEASRYEVRTKGALMTSDADHERIQQQQDDQAPLGPDQQVLMPFAQVVPQEDDDDE